MSHKWANVAWCDQAPSRCHHSSLRVESRIEERGSALRIAALAVFLRLAIIYDRNSDSTCIGLQGHDAPTREELESQGTSEETTSGTSPTGAELICTLLKFCVGLFGWGFCKVA